MSSSEECDTSDEDLQDAWNGDPYEESSSDESNAASHEVRVKVMTNILEHLSELPRAASVDPEVVKTVSHFKDENFMPEGSKLELECVYPDEDDEDQEEEWSVYYSYDTQNYLVEVRAFEDESYYYAIQVFHKPDRRVVNSGHVYTTYDVVLICDYLANDMFKEAMLLLFARYGGGAKDQQFRSEDMLEWIVGECEVRSTTSGIDL
jgi:hypothetical protein